MDSINSVNIRPGVSILSVLKHLNYKPYYALAEFVDNAIDSYQKNERDLISLEGADFKLIVQIEINQTDNKITVRDNAGGIRNEDFTRAFRAAEIPPDTSGLSEFGMGMKSAACWFSGNWRVTSKALGEDVERIISFDIEKIVEDKIEELEVKTRKVNPNHHYTTIELFDIHQRMPRKRTISKIKAHLSSIYRDFFRKGFLELYFRGEHLVFDEPIILNAPFHKSPNNPIGDEIYWNLPIDFPVEEGLSVRGFVAIRKKGSTSEAGLALFRRGRVILGSADEAYRPIEIFGNPNSYRYQRIFGELHLEGFQVSHTKDGFQGDENMETFIELLRDELDTAEFPLLKQAENYRVRPTAQQVKKTAENVLNSTVNSIGENMSGALEKMSRQGTEEDSFGDLQVIEKTSFREIEVEFYNRKWRICFELSYDPSVTDWIEVGDSFINNPSREEGVRNIGIRLSLIHPFMVTYAGTNKLIIEPLLRLAAAIGLAEITAKESGVRNTKTIRRNINYLLKEALIKNNTND